MKTTLGAVLRAAVLAMGAMALWHAPVAAAEDDDTAQFAQPAAARTVYGKTLKEWLGTYWRWNITGADPAKSMVRGVKLLPLPDGKLITGKRTPEDPELWRGQSEITLPEGTPFVLPLAAWITERYQDGSEDEGYSNRHFLAGVSPYLIIDGKLKVSNANKRDIYVPLTPFHPIVAYDKPTDYKSVAATAYQGYGIVSRPLPVGKHHIHLYVWYVVTKPLTYAVIYDNTWIITVKPK